MHKCMCTINIPGMCESSGRVSDCLEQELHIIVSGHVGPKNQTQVL